MKSMILLCVCTVLVLRLETSSAARISIQGPHHHPIYKYSCNEDLSVTFKGVNGEIKYFPADSKNKSCNITKILHHDGNFRLSKECMSNIDFTLPRTVKIAVYDKNEEENIPPTISTETNESSTEAPPETTPLVSGGHHHIFEITCLPLEKKGVERIALAETGITDIEHLHHVYNEIGQVEMRFKEGESLDKPDLSEVYIGDRFYMYLKYMGDTRQYTIMPQLCTAYKGTYRNENDKKMNLWSYNNDTKEDCVTKDARAYNVMNNFKRINSTIVHAELFGFRFSPSLGGDASDVTISCSVKICTSASGPCTSSCDMKSVSYRRKRDTGTIRSQVVSKTLKVRYKTFDSNDAGRTGLCSGTVGIIIASILFHMLWK